MTMVPSGSNGIIFTRIELECFEEDVVGEHIDSHPWVEPACTSLLDNHPQSTCTLTVTSAFFNPQQLPSICNTLFPVVIFDSLHCRCSEGWVVGDGTGVQFQVLRRQDSD